MHMKEIDYKDDNGAVRKKHNIYCEFGFILGVFSLFYSGFFIIPLTAAAVSFIGLVTYKNSRHRDKWKAYWGLLLGTLLTLTNFV